jgi:hypothetical protein
MATTKNTTPAGKTNVTVPTPTGQQVRPSDMTVAQLQSFLAVNSVAVPAKAKKDDLVSLALQVRYEAPVAKAGRKARTDADGQPLKFAVAEHPDGFTCRTCGEHKHLAAFPTVSAPAGQPRTHRQTSCRDCREVRNGHKVWAD